MRLFLIPLSPGKSLLYCKKVELGAGVKATLGDRIAEKTTRIWQQWEKAERGWKRHLVIWGDKMLHRIPYQEWGLKSVPPLSSRRSAQELAAQMPLELLFPRNVLRESRVLAELRTLATERQELHRRRMLWSFVMAPLTLPIALIPLIPNIPFFYLAYRGWSHWRALGGSRHIEFLLDHQLVHPRSLPALERLYVENHAAVTGQNSVSDHLHDAKILLDHADGKRLATLLDAPELALEVERAVFQIRHLGQKEEETG